MPSLSAKLRDAEGQLSHGQVQLRGDEYVAVLREFAEELSKLRPDVDAWTEWGSVPNLFNLYLAPKLRRTERSIMLSCWLVQEGLQCANSVFTTAQEFETFLVDFYKNPTFQESLNSFSERSRADVHGLLRMAAATIRAQTDEIFRVEPSEFEKLITAKAGTVLTIRAEKEPRGDGRSRPLAPAETTVRLRRFRYFGVNGHGLVMSNVEHEDREWYRLTGVVQPFGTIR